MTAAELFARNNGGPPAECRHRPVFDPVTWEVVCERCGVAIPLFENKALAYAPQSARLSSPSVAGNGNGTDIDASIRDLRRGVVDPLTGKRTHILSGMLKRLDSRESWDEALVVELSNRLHGRVSNANLAAVAQIFRKGLRHLEAERRAKALTLLDQISGRDRHE